MQIVCDDFFAVQERDGSNTVVHEYTWGLNLGGGIGGLLNLKQGGQDYAYLYDGKGNVAAVLDATQAVVAAYRYDPFGRLLAKTGTLEQPFGFSTKRYDTQTGLVYYGYRFYSPTLGRWTSRDPLDEAGGLNLYAFVGNNPVNWVDPWGLWVDNNSPCMVYFKPAGKNDYPNTILDESSAVPVAPGSCSVEPVQDGIAVPCHPEHSNDVLKTVNGVNVTVNPDSTVTLSHGWRPWLWGLQQARGGWKGKEWLFEDLHKRDPKPVGDRSWDELFKKTGAENCQCEK